LGAITEHLEHDLILSMLPTLQGKRVLDVGCGDGALTEKLAKLGAEVIGIDANPDMIAAAMHRNAGRYLVADASALPFEDDTFDAVTAMTVLCVCDDPKILVGEMARVLKPGGHLMIGELGRWSLWALSRRLRGLASNRTWRHVHFFTMAELKTLAVESGLHLRTARGAIYYPPFNLTTVFLSKIDTALGRVFGALGAAFIALSTQKH
jgi:ubiquinone/menaquinone biosynthesis C-methylase UbiE